MARGVKRSRKEVCIDNINKTEEKIAKIKTELKALEDTNIKFKEELRQIEIEEENARRVSDMNEIFDVMAKKNMSIDDLKKLINEREEEVVAALSAEA